MILQALAEYYERTRPDMPPEGFEVAPISFLIDIAGNGSFLGLSDIRVAGGRKVRAAAMMAPSGQDRTGPGAWKTAFLLWDHPRYVLGIPPNDSAKEVALSPKRMGVFIDRIKEDLGGPSIDAAVTAVLRFYTKNEHKKVVRDRLFPALIKANGNLSFRLASDTGPVFQRLGIVDRVRKNFAVRRDGPVGQCLVTGDVAPIALLDRATPIRNSKSTAKLRSYNKIAFESYGKTDRQGENAPVSRQAAFQFATALNHLTHSRRQRLDVGDATTVFWTQKPDELEEGFGSIFGGGDAPDHTDELHAVLEAIYSGKFDGGRGENRFFVLGLAPNAARISVRFWHAEPLRDIARRIRQWFEDIAIDRGKNEPQYLSLKRLLTSVCLATKDRPYGDIDRLPPAIGGGVARAIFSGVVLPAALLNAALHRCRAEQAKKEAKTGRPVRHVPYARAAVIKACLNRHYRFHAHNRKEIAVSLDKSNTDVPYVLGRLFATFERMQELAAERELNRTIRDSFFGGAMATPRSVFSRLVALNQTHLRNLKRSRPGAATNFDKLLREINDKLNPKTAFPAGFNLMDQGVFAIGYYHQRHDFFPKDSKLTFSQSTSALTSNIEGNRP